MKRKFALLLTVTMLVCFSHTIESQALFRPGFVITLDKDSLLGEIEEQPLQHNYNDIEFKNQSGEITSFKPKDILEFGINGARRYKSIKVDSNIYFLNVLFEGKVGLYTLINDHGEFTFFLDKSGLGIREITYTEEIQRSNINQYVTYNKVKSTKHFGILSLYMADAKYTLKKIPDIKKPTENNLLKLLQSYHNEVCPEDKCYIFIDPTPKHKIIGEPTIFLMKHNISSPRNHNDFVIHYGGNVYVQFPRTNRYSGLRVGLALGQRDYINISNKSNSIIFARVSIHGMLLYPTGIVRPKASLGFDIHNPRQLGLGGMVGVNVQVTRKMAISINYDKFLFGLFSNSNGFGSREETVAFNPSSLSLGVAFDFQK